MGNFRIQSSICVLLAVLAFCCVSCKKEDPTTLKFDNENVYIMPNEFAIVEATLNPAAESAVVSYESGNTSIATVETIDGKCKISGVATGSVTVTASCNGKTAVCNVLVMTPEQLAQYLPAERNTSIGKFIRVNAGAFRMGSATGAANEQPVHNVTLTKPYYIAQFELTQEIWEAVMEANPSVDQNPQYPVNNVAYTNITSFIKKLAEVKGYVCRLPTEAEWEYAARGGDKSQGYQYSGSNSIDAVAWYDGNGGELPHQVGTKAANELGLFDMSGNILEMCADGLRTYTSSDVVDPKGTGTRYAVRGGKFDSPESECTVSYRTSAYTTDKFYNLGFRLVLE